MVGNFPCLLPPQSRSENAGPVDAVGPGCQRTPAVVAKGTVVLRAQRIGTETELKPAVPTRRGRGPTCGQHF